MEPPPIDVEDTFLTERQAEVLSMRNDGATQREIAEEFGTTVANVSAIERAGRDNVGRSRRTLTLARLLRASTRLSAPAGEDLRDIVDAIYDAGDESGIRIAYSEPELVSELHDHLGESLENRRLTDAVLIGITEDGEVLTHPSSVVPGD